MSDEITDFLRDLEQACAPNGKEPRKRSRLAVVATLKFLKSIGCEPRLKQPPYELLRALEDADEGVSNPITKPAEHPGGSPRPKKGMLDKARQAVTVTSLMEAGMTLDEALNQVTGIASLADKKALEEFRKNWRMIEIAREYEMPAKEKAAATLAYVKA